MFLNIWSFVTPVISELSQNQCLWFDEEHGRTASPVLLPCHSSWWFFCVLILILIRHFNLGPVVAHAATGGMVAGRPNWPFSCTGALWMYWMRARVVSPSLPSRVNSYPPPTTCKLCWRRGCEFITIWPRRNWRLVSMRPHCRSVDRKFLSRWRLLLFILYSQRSLGRGALGDKSS